MENTDLQDYAIFTIGHGNKGISDFIEILKRYEINVLIDVRSIPYSRYHPQFRQGDLKDSLEAAGINYIWLGKELGGRPSDPALYNEGKVDYQAIKETALFADGIKHVQKLARQGIKVTLMCSESNPNDCHRKHLIGDKLERLGYQLLHINKLGKIDYIE